MVSYSFDPHPASSSSAATSTTSSNSSSAASLPNSEFASSLSFTAYPPSTVTWPAPPGFATGLSMPAVPQPEALGPPKTPKRAANTTTRFTLPGSGFASFTRPPTFSTSPHVPLAVYPPSTTTLPPPTSFTRIQPRHDPSPPGIHHVDWPRNFGVRKSQETRNAPSTFSETSSPPTRPMPAATQVARPDKRGVHTASSQSSLQMSLESPTSTFISTTPPTPAPLQDDEAIFPSQKADTFRYAFTVEDDKLSIWLENKKTKAQWESDPLALDEFVALESLIPMATIEDYVQCFEACVAQSRADPEQTSCDLRQLTHQRDDELQLELQIRIQLFTRVLTPTYRFTLYEVELDRIDVLTARVRSQEDELARLRAEINALEDGKAGLNSNLQHSEPIYFQAETTAIARHTSTPFGGPEYDNGAETFQLLQNGHTVAASSDKNLNGSFVDRTVLSSPLQRVLTLQKNDALSVMYTGYREAVAGSSIIVFRLH
uniref:Uncharacterized protein n=1 Tax=Globisporangium ultimum (strain ATCC 200006 / CBS 805.95 / DAOM BR144) TaxID=431595 RepID=K3X5C3_GLOUD